MDSRFILFFIGAVISGYIQFGRGELAQNREENRLPVLRIPENMKMNYGRNLVVEPVEEVPAVNIMLPEMVIIARN
jgi:hypothetical protein